MAADGPATAWALSQVQYSDAAGMPYGAAELLRFDHGWSVAALPDKAWRLTALESGGTASVWGVGFVISAGRSSFAPLLVHWDGSSWRQIRLPGGLQVAGTEAEANPAAAPAATLSIQAASGDRVWLEKNNPTPASTLLYYDGVWHQQAAGGTAAIWLADLAGRAPGPWLALPAGEDEVSEVAYGPGGAVWPYGEQVVGEGAPGGVRHVLFRLRRGRLAPIGLPAIGQDIAASMPQPLLAVDAAADPVLIAEPWLANRLLYAIYDADRGKPAWELQEGPDHPGAQSIGAAAATTFPGSGALLVVGNATRRPGDDVAVADAARLAGAPAAPALAAQPVPLPSGLTPGWDPTALPRTVVAPVTLTSVSAAGADDALAGGAEDVGYAGASDIRSPAGLPLILHWNGRAWSKQRVASSFFGSITSIAAGRSGAGWAIAEDAEGRYHLLHLSAGTWQETSFPGQGRPGLDLTSITAAPDGTAWVTGDSQPSSSTGAVQAPLILHWIAGTWQQVPPPANDWWPVQITATPSGVWLAAQAAYRVDPLHSDWEVILARRTADGWQAVRAPAMGGASGFLATGGTLGLAAVRGSVWVAAAAPPPVKIGGPPISVAPPSPPCDAAALVGR